ncbi:MAG: hypothetical protein ACKO3W_03535 [bacterium]
MRLLRNVQRQISLTAALVLASAAFGQGQPPPEPVGRPEPGPVVGYLVMAVLFGIIVAISLMPSKRAHTDL